MNEKPKTDNPSKETQTLVKKPLPKDSGMDGYMVWWQTVEVIDFYAHERKTHTMRHG